MRYFRFACCNHGFLSHEELIEHLNSAHGAIEMLDRLKIRFPELKSMSSRERNRTPARLELSFEIVWINVQGDTRMDVNIIRDEYRGTSVAVAD